MITSEHIEKFSQPLTEILNEELHLGNEIAETSASVWSASDQEIVVILLKKPFNKQYEVEGIAYREINDPHYWKSEYLDKNQNHILGCGF